MNYESAIGLCLALVVLMLAVDIALRKSKQEFGVKPQPSEPPPPPPSKFVSRKWHNPSTNLFDEIEPEQLPTLAVPRGAIGVITSKTYFIVREGMFYSLTLQVFTNHPKHPHYVALNFA